jgi:hypothetical protein
MDQNLEFHQALMEKVWHPAIADNLLRFVHFAFPWGQPGTPLEAFPGGPYQWQAEELQETTDHIAIQKAGIHKGISPRMYRKAIASGRGPGKSAFLGWIACWIMATRPGATCIVSANSEAQLRTKTFPEISKWFNMAIFKDWFDVDVLRVEPKAWFKKALEDQLQIDSAYNYCAGQLWSEESPDSYAGAHNPYGLAVLYDEASGIPNSIFQITHGFFTEKSLNRFWFAFSNPRRNSGGFYDCFHESAKLWKTRHVDAREVPELDQAIYADLIRKYGADSDEVRIEVYGQFPKQGEKQFISSAVVREAQDRTVEPDPHASLILGIDVARFGSGSTVLRWRQGRDARTIPPVKVYKSDNMAVANLVASWIDKTAPDAVNIDVGNGTGVIDRLREMKYRVNEIGFGTTASDSQYADKRTEMWGRMRDWLPSGMIDRDSILYGDLTAPEYGFGGKGKDQIKLESKEALSARGIKSPDDGDALALTFAVNVARRDRPSMRRGPTIARDLNYPIFGDDRKG